MHSSLLFVLIRFHIHLLQIKNINVKLINTKMTLYWYINYASLYFVQEPIYWSRKSSVRRLDDQGVGRPETFLFFTTFQAVLGATQAPIKWVPGAISKEVKRQGREDDHSLPSSVEVNGEDIPPLPRASSWRCAKLITSRDNFTLADMLRYIRNKIIKFQILFFFNGSSSPFRALASYSVA
jgi:hypothetical protein